MRSIFAQHSIPKVVFSDDIFKTFSKSWNFIHKTSSPKFPQSVCNEFVEGAIQNIKETLRKCREDNSGSYLAMLALRTTKYSSGTTTSVADEKKVANTNTFAKRKCKHQNKTQETNCQPIQRFNH